MHLEVGSYWRFRGIPYLITNITTLSGTGIAPEGIDQWRFNFSNATRVTPIECEPVLAGEVYQHDIQNIELEDMQGHVSYITVYERLRRIGNGPTRSNRADSKAVDPEVEGAGAGPEGWPSNWESFAG